MYRTYFYLSQVKHYLSKSRSSMTQDEFIQRLEAINEFTGDDSQSKQFEYLEADSGLSYLDVSRLFGVYQQELVINSNPERLKEEKRRDYETYYRQVENLSLAELKL